MTHQHHDLGRCRVLAQQLNDYLDGDLPADLEAQLRDRRYPPLRKRIDQELSNIYVYSDFRQGVGSATVVSPLKLS